MSETTLTPEKQTQDLLSRPLIGTINLDWEKTIYLIFIVLTIITRFWALGDRVMSHDESLHTQFSFQFFNGQGYNHTPLMHGPFLFHITSISYWLFGDNDFAARIPVALFGIILIVMPYLLRNWLGRVGALFTSFIFLISPYVTYYSRYIRHDVYVIVWAMIAFIAIWYYFDHQKDKYLWWFVAGTALMFVTKEVAFIYVAIFGSFLVIRLLVKIIPSSWFSLRKLVTPLIIFLAGLLLLGAGFVAQRTVSDPTGVETTIEATEGFAADPNADQFVEGPSTAATGTEIFMRWVQIIGIAVLSLGLFLAARTLRPEIDRLPEFDLILLFSTLLLPLASPLLTKMAGWNPTDYTLNHCQLAGQESMSALQVLIGRLGNSVCWSSFFQSGVVRSGIFLVLTMIVAVLVGLWWNRRRWLISAAIFYSILLVFFTSVFTNLGGWSTGIVGSLGYWLEQQEVQRGSQPVFYYLFVVPFYEFLPLIFSLLAIRLWSHKKRTNRVIGYWVGVLLLALLGYSLANWVYMSNLVDGQESTILPGLLLGGLIVIIGLIFWFIYQRRSIIAEYELEHGVSELFVPQTLLEFVPFLVWWLLLTWLVYSYAGEKMPWLSIHFVIPMGMLVGYYFDEKLAHFNIRVLFSRSALLLFGLTILLIVTVMLIVGPLLWGTIRLGSQEMSNLQSIGRFLGLILIAGLVFFFWQRFYRQADSSLRNRVIILSFFILLSLLTIRFAYMASFTNADYTTEFMVYAHGAPATKEVVLDQVEELSMRLNGDKSIKVAFDSDVSWPLTWYLREYPNRVFFGENPTQDLNQSPVIIVGARNWDKVEPYLGNNYEYTEHTFLWWPMEEYRKISLNAVFGDPNVPKEQRRGLGNADVRQALWDIFFYRDYEKYGQVFGGTYTTGEWPLRHNLRMYVHKDTLPTLWDYGVGAVAAGGQADPYAEGEIMPSAIMILNESAIAGSGFGQLSAPRNMAVGPDGRIYVLDSSNHRVQVFDEFGLPLSEWGSFGEGAGQFNEPWGIAIDDTYVYIADTWNHRIQKFTLDGDFVTSFGASGSPSPENADPGLGLFFGPRSVVLLDENQILVTDTGNHRMQLFDRNGTPLQQIGGFGNLLGQMNEPVGIGRGSNGSVYLADTWNSRIQQYTDSLLALSEWPVDAWSGTSINNKPYIAVDSSGRVYVTDPEGYRVLIFSPDGAYLGRFGSFGAGSSNLNIPNGIFIDAMDNVYVADSGNNRILKFAALFGPVQGSNNLPAQDDSSNVIESAPEMGSDGSANDGDSAAPQDDSLEPTAAEDGS
ncbi:MAG: TIGR03663 family protein [Candidatus Promineifilaceae bacterium]|nr:TIGR03663 family protein [Candidatus Promineifilaceae bacterium]